MPQSSITPALTPLLQTLLWILLIAGLIYYFRKALEKLRKQLEERLDRGLPIDIGPLKLSKIEEVAIIAKEAQQETGKLRSETGIRQKQTDDELSKHQEQLDWNVAALENIIAFMPGYFAHQALCQIRDKADEKYNDSNSHKKRILNLLLDNGYLQTPPGLISIEFSENSNGKKLFEIAELTPMARQLLKLRKEVGEKSVLTKST